MAQLRCSWPRSAFLALALGFLSYRLTESFGVLSLPVVCAALVAARHAWLTMSKLAFSLELRSLRRRAAVALPPYNELRLELLTQAEHPDGQAFARELELCRAHHHRRAARRRLALLSAGVDLGAR